MIRVAKISTFFGVVALCGIGATAAPMLGRVKLVAPIPAWAPALVSFQSQIENTVKLKALGDGPALLLSRAVGADDEDCVIAEGQPGDLLCRH